MSDFLNKYPYTDFHELNLDWIISKVKELAAEWADTKNAWEITQADWQELHDYVMNYFDNLDIQDEIDNKINEMISDGTFVQLVGDLFYYKTPQMYGAIGDGVTDDTQAIQQCVNENPKTVIPAGIYLISDTIDVPADHEIEMAGHVKTFLTMYPFDNYDTSAYTVIRSETNVPMFQIHKAVKLKGGIIYAHNTDVAIYVDIGKEMISNLDLDTGIVGVESNTSTAVYFDGSTGTTGYLTISDIRCAIANFDRGYFIDRPTGQWPWITFLNFGGNIFNCRKGLTNNFTNFSFSGGGSRYEFSICGGYADSNDAIFDLTGDSLYIDIMVSDVGPTHHQKYAIDLSRVYGGSILINNIFADYIMDSINPGTFINTSLVNTISDTNGTVKYSMSGKQLLLNINGTWPTGTTEYTIPKITFMGTAGGDYTVSTNLIIRIAGNDNKVRIINGTGAAANISHYNLSLFNF